MRTVAMVVILALGAAVLHAGDATDPWVDISAPVLAKLTEENKKVGWPGATGGVAVDRATGAVYVVICDQGLWKSSDQGKTFERVDGGAVGGRTETGFALNTDPAGKRMMCFMIYGSSGRSVDAGATWQKSKVSHLDFGAVDWSEAAAARMLSLKHESGGELLLTTDAGATWNSLGKGFKQLGMFDGGVLVASKGEGILRSTDDGKTWTSVSPLKPAAYVMKTHNGVGYWLSDGGLLVSKDKGLTWEQQGGKVKAYLGPYFGKEPSQLIVAGKDGIYESTDGAATWNVIAKWPVGFPGGPVGPNLDYDPQHNILYVSCMGKPTFKWAR